MQNQKMMAFSKSFTLETIIHQGFVILWKCQLFLDELEKYDKQAKAMRRDDRLGS
ncbi:hypothetical protein C942_03432 [Photobacterium marinum]|uniref:Uncharacterized protein n=1 Tax=Photobacterium marinum TaxID=1056511 RepID=L8J6H0_9GAMM|nr:hypothetical protein [Photobacterium marinum]ELR63763.1 hypothetical protein C942_03432 [Photobacterium marinum]